MPKPATPKKSPPQQNASTSKPANPAALNGSSKSTKATASKTSLPQTIVAALPAGAEIIKHVQAIEALLPALTSDLAKANKAGAVMLARAFVVMHRLNERMLSEEKAFKPFRELYAVAKVKLVPTTFEVAGVDSIPLSEGFRVGVSERTVASIKVGKKPEAYAWLQDNEKGDVIVPTVNASTLSALAKQLRENNIDLPEELFNVQFLPNASVTPT